MRKTGTFLAESQVRVRTSKSLGIFYVIGLHESLRCQIPFCRAERLGDCIWMLVISGDGIAATLDQERS